jgi:hypothetical protein
MPHLSVVALSSRGSLLATGCFGTPIVGRLRLWASSGALGVLLIVLRCKVFSPLWKGSELYIFVVSIAILG